MLELTEDQIWNNGFDYFFERKINLKISNRCNPEAMLHWDRGFITASNYCEAMSKAVKGTDS